jgi:uncharacterized membrane protein
VTSPNGGSSVPDVSASVERQLALLFACFAGRKTAGKARRGLEAWLRGHRDDRLDTVVLEVDEKHRASTHDPRRVWWGTWTAAIVWGLCGALDADGWATVVFWAVVGAVGGALFNYYATHRLTKPQMTRIGSRLPAESSALAIWVGTEDARRVLEATATREPSAASVAVVGADLTTRVYAEPAHPVELPPRSVDEPDDAALLSIVMLRYPRPGTAKRMASQAGDEDAEPSLDVALVIRCDDRGRVHVTDMSFGAKAAAKSDVRSWGGFGLVFGAVVGAVGGGGVLGFIEGGLLTALAWGVLGLGAGALYGLVAGTTFSARSLRSVRPASTPGTSTLIAWVGKPITARALGDFMTPGTQSLVLNLRAGHGGAVLGATSTPRQHPN